MQTARRFLITILVPALIVSIFAVGAAAASGSSGKVNLCHFADHKFVKITVAMSAKPAHMSHGDVDPDEYGDCSGDHEGDHEGDQDGDHDGDHDGHGGVSHDDDRSKSGDGRDGSTQASSHSGGESSKGNGNKDD
jgi:uncharacterized membrane protein YgcG